jgi:uncharacterized protein (DUF58 family)
VDLQDILKTVKRIEITTSHLAEDLFSGEYKSVFKGRGMEFAEVRQYQIGDDVRTIDWNVTARMGHPYVKRYTEERELTVAMLVDASASFDFGSRGRFKASLAAELCAVLAFAAIGNNDRVGLVVFDQTVRRFLPPRKGRRHVLRVVREVLGTRARGKGTDLAGALEYACRVFRRRTVLFVISDFMCDDFERQLRAANNAHDVIALVVGDPWETALPKLGLLALEDAETGEVALVEAGRESVRRLYAEAARRRRARLQSAFQSAGVDYVELFTDRPYAPPLMDFFRRRALRIRRLS